MLKLFKSKPKRFIVTIVLLSVIGGLFLLSYTRSPSLRNMERDFNRNREHIMVIVDYLLELGYEVIIFSARDFSNDPIFADSRHRGIMLVGTDNSVRTMRVEDEGVWEALATLSESGYSSISKRAGAISFQRWTRLFDAGWGAVYSVNGLTPGEDSLMFLIEIVPLSEEGWYFYSEDFNRWRARNNEW